MSRVQRGIGHSDDKATELSQLSSLVWAIRQVNQWSRRIYRAPVLYRAVTEKKVAQYSPVITVNAMFAFIARYRSIDPPAVSVF